MDKKLKIRSEQLDSKIRDLQTLLKHFPEGDLICARNGSQYKWYRKNDTGTVYLPKMNKELAEQLALKKYYKAVLNDLLTEQNAIHAYLKKIKEPSGIKVLQHPEYGRLLESHFKPISKELSDWADEPYEKNLTHPEHLLHKSSSNIPVRSKSESLIASSLYSHQIPFRYECSLRLRDLNLHEALFYPDFTIRHPKNGKTYYWEHFGLMDQEAYAKNAGKKLQIYIANGIIPSIQLITTYETKENPLNIMMVEDVIRQYFL